MNWLDTFFYQNRYIDDELPNTNQALESNLGLMNLTDLEITDET